MCAAGNAAKSKCRHVVYARLATTAMILIGAGVDPTVVRDILGHSTVAFTLQQYNTPDQSDQRRALAVFSTRGRH
jgi:integrase